MPVQHDMDDETTQAINAETADAGMNHPVVLRGLLQCIDSFHLGGGGGQLGFSLLDHLKQARSDRLPLHIEHSRDARREIPLFENLRHNLVRKELLALQGSNTFFRNDCEQVLSTGGAIFVLIFAALAFVEEGSLMAIEA